MLGSSLISKSYLLKSSSRGMGFKVIFSELKHCKKPENVHFCNKTFISYPYKQLYVNRFNSAIKLSSFRYNSSQARVEAKNEKYQQTNSYFQEQLHDRKMQAHRSVLVEIRKKEDIPYAFAHCEKFGTIKNAYSYSGEKENCFLLLEFSDENAAKILLKKCECRKVPDIVPVYSRLLQYEKKHSTKLSEVRIDEENISKSLLKPGASISEIIQDIYSTEKLTELDTRLRYFFCTLIKESVSGLLPYCEVIPFGSSVNGIGRHGCDLDATLILDSKQVNDNSELYFMNRTYAGKPKIYQQKLVFCLAEIFRSFFPGISSVEKILLARVPIVKMYNKILNLQCDLSVHNMSALHMSNIIHYCGEIDDRVRPLIYSVKKWAKEARITFSEPGTWISNFGLTNLVIFFLQNRPNPILPPFNDALIIVGEDNDPHFGVNYLKSIDEWKSWASLNKESLAVLLKEFLLFMATEPFQEYIISLMSGQKRTRPQEDRLPLWMQYPFDESLNITKHVSSSEFDIMQEKAKISAKYLENNLKLKDNHVKDFCVLLGIPSVSDMNVSDKIDVNSLIKNEKSSKKVKHGTL